MTDCTDGTDNDGDGLVDELDPACPFTMGENEFDDPTQCNDGIDNDTDTLIDLDDYGCDDAADDEEQDPTRQCNDGVDNDGDEFVDAAGGDPGCESPIDDDESNPALCGNGIDDDGDARIDYPFDPGCDSEEDSNETDPATPPLCSDLVDNDLDDLIDFGADPGCNSAADNDEFNTETGECGPSVVITDITVTGEATGTIDGPRANELTSPVCNGYGGEFAFTFQVMNADSALYISTDYPETTLDTVVYVRQTCLNPATEFECNDDAPDPSLSPSGSTLIIEKINPGSYFVIVDAFGPGSLGTFRLTVEERAGLGADCDASDPDACVPGLICQPRLPGDPDTCEYPRCDDDLDQDGDGILDFPLEPGCDSLLDNDETDPVPAPDCANGLDDDGDGIVDYPGDPGCEFAADDVEIDECYPGKEVLILDPVTGVTGSTSTSSAMTGGGCGGADSPEDVYVISTDVPLVSLTASTVNTGTSGFDSILYVRADDCDGGIEVACNDDVSFSDTRSTVTWSPITGEDYFVFIDSKWGATGSYDIDISGVIAAGGECDPAIPTFTCVSGYACRESVPGVTDWQCRIARCNDTIDNDGDGFVDFPNDPGCATSSDDAEDFPNPVTACSDGVDNDGDLLIDFAGGDPGCFSAADNGEIDECVPGHPVIDHPGGTVSGDTTGAPSLLGAPGACDLSGGSSATSPEEVHFFDVDTDYSSLTFSTAGSAMDTILYVRSGDCAIAGPDSWCNDNTAGSSAEVVITDPAPGNYFVIVDGVWSGSGSYSLSITGVIDLGGACTAGDTNFTCELGTFCNASGVCEGSPCNDGIDNDGDGDVDYPADPGCTSISDADETDPAVLPQCADGIDNDADGDIDWPMDSSCGAASDDNEACLVFGSTAGGYSGCTDVATSSPGCENLAALGTGISACSSDDCVTPGVAIGFTFNYFGIDRTTIDISSNGKFGFGTTSSYSNSCDIESQTMAVHWDDLYPPGGGAVRYQTFGTAPNRHFTVQWNIPHIGGGNLYDMRATIYEGTNDIDFCYVDTSNGTGVPFGTESGNSATIGIRGATSAEEIEFSCNLPNATDGLLVHFDAP